MGTPPFNYQYDAVMGADLGFDSPVRNQDADDYEFGVPSIYKKQADLISSEQSIAEDNAMAYLQQALKKSTYVSPEQGWATALLGIIPTIGGYMIGKSVGQPDLPAGYFEAGGTRAAAGLDKMRFGGAAGGLAGVEGGLNAAGGYLKSLEADQAQANDVYAKMAQIESNKASRLQTRADQYELAGLNKQAELEMMPLREASQMRLQDNSARNQMERTLEMEKRRDEREQMSPEALAVAQDSLGIPRDPNMSTRSLQALTNAVAENRRGVGQDARISGEIISAPSVTTKNQIKGIMVTKELGNRYISKLEQQAKVDPSWLERNITKTLPATELGELQKTLKLYAVQVRNAFENGVMTEPDFERYSSYLTLGELDTIGSVLGRLRELQTSADLSAIATLKVAKAGRENISGFESLLGIQIPDYFPNPKGTSYGNGATIDGSQPNLGGGQGSTGYPGQGLGTQSTAGGYPQTGGQGVGGSQLQKPIKSQNESSASYLGRLKQYNAQVELLKKNGRR